MLIGSGYWRYAVAYCFHFEGLLAQEEWPLDFQALRLEAVRSSETSIAIYQSIRHNMPEDVDLHGT
jgi:hypothetical protein